MNAEQPPMSVASLIESMQMQAYYITLLQTRLVEAEQEIRSLKETLAAQSKAKVTYTLEPNQHFWSEEEHARFLQGVELHGAKNAKAISKFVRTRTPTQVRSPAQK